LPLRDEIHKVGYLLQGVRVKRGRAVANGSLRFGIGIGRSVGCRTLGSTHRKPSLRDRASLERRRKSGGYYRSDVTWSLLGSSWDRISMTSYVGAELGTCEPGRLTQNHVLFTSIPGCVPTLLRQVTIQYLWI
jgi:hypothetical protein